MPARRQRSTIAGRLDVTSMLLRDRRVTVRIYVPADYEWSAREYPVLYMFDGHNLFDRTTSTYNKEWRVDETMEASDSPAIVVGIDAPQNRYDRFEMYSLGDWEYQTRPDGRLLRRIRGYADETAAFLMGQVRPWVERTYRACSHRDHVGVAGSSMGGYMALLVGAAYPDSVCKVMAFSPVAMDDPMRGYLLRDRIVSARAVPAQRYYLDMGDREKLDFVRDPQILVDHLEQLHQTLLTAGHQEVLARVIPGGRHDERAWGRRFPEAYLWAFHAVQPG
jgi:enterochelin esterase-like enzyme